MEPYRVFISSIMNRSVDDLFAERESARSAVEHFAPITQAWAFEAQPASSKPLLDFYLDAVKTCDLLILVLASKATPPVLREYQTALEYQRPVLAFFKSVPEREPEVERIKAEFGAKWESFENSAELREKVRRALGTELLRLIRGEALEANRPGDRLARLRVLKGENRSIRVTPMIPRIQYDQFRIEDVTPQSVRLHKISNKQEVTIPSTRVQDVLDNGAATEPTIVLDGRLQFLTPSDEWRFFPEKPPANDPLDIGFGAGQSSNDPAIEKSITQRGLTAFFSLPANIPARIQDGAQVFFDEQGRHRVWGEQVLLVRRKQTGE